MQGLKIGSADKNRVRKLPPGGLLGLLLVPTFRGSRGLYSLGPLIPAQSLSICLMPTVRRDVGKGCGVIQGEATVLAWSSLGSRGETDTGTTGHEDE